MEPDAVRAEPQAVLPAIPPFAYGPPAPIEQPGRTLGIVGFALSFVGFLNVMGLILSIVAMTQSRRAGQKNGFALAGIIISIVGIVFCGVILALIVPSLIHAAHVCSEMGLGTHVIGNATYTCTPTSFSYVIRQ